MGLGNARYARGDLDAAAEAFGAAAWIHPEAAPAFNNLAQVLSDLGRRDEAIHAARGAVALGGSLSEIYRQTLPDLYGSLSALLGIMGARPPRAANPGTP